jgi:hypothetical protein
MSSIFIARACCYLMIVIGCEERRIIRSISVYGKGFCSSFSRNKCWLFFGELGTIFTGSENLEMSAEL